MIIQKMPAFQPVVAGQRALLQIPKYDLTLTRFVLTLGGTFTKAQIDQINVKIGAKTVWDVTGSELDKINKYVGLYDDSTHLTLDFTERDAPDIVGKEIGGIDMTQISDPVYVEVKINAAAVNPTLAGQAFWTPPQGNNLIKKLVKITTATLSTSWQDVTFNAQGALIQRLFLMYTGTDWTSSTNGNVNSLRVKKNGVPVWEEVADLDARFIQQEYKKVPQSRMYVYDPIVDNNQSGALVTSDAKSLQIQPNLTASDTLTAVFQVLDLPGNL